MNGYLTITTKPVRAGEEAANAANTAANGESTVKRSVVIAKATAGAVSAGLVSVPFGGADLAIENANTPWLNLVGAGLAPVEGYAHTITEQGIKWLGRQTPGS